MIQSRQIEAFRAVMRTGAMTAAAESINVTQPAVSRLVRDLELELSLTLFHRRGNLVVPTTEAHALLAEVDRLFIGLGQIRTFADDLRAGRTGTLRVAALPAMAGGFLPRFVASFCRERPHLKVLVEGLPSTTIRDRVIAGQFDIGVTGFPFQRDQLTAIPLNDPAVVVMPSGHRLAARRRIQVSDLEDEKLIMLTKFQDGLHPLEVALQPIQRRTAIETSLSTIACVLAAEGMGVAIVDPFSASEFAGRGLVLRAFDPEVIIGTGVVHARDRALSLVAQEFHTEFLAHTRSFIAEARYLDA